MKIKSTIAAGATAFFMTALLCACSEQSRTDAFVSDRSSVKYGDINQDGEVTLEDAWLSLSAALRIADLDESGRKAMNVNQDNQIDLLDVQTILKKALQIISKFPAEDTLEKESVTEGTEKYRGFLLDNVLHSKTEGDIHYHIYLPDSYDGTRPFALFITLPGYEGLYFQGVGVNLRSEEFGFTAQEYNPDMIVVAPQLSDWGETSAKQTIELVEYLLSHYHIDYNKVYANGYSGGGETMSLVMGMRPDLFTAYLHCSSQWDGEYEPIVENRTPVYLVIGENDEYYGSGPSKEAYAQLYELYERKGLSEEEINELLVLDIKDSLYFKRQGIFNQHGGGAALFSNDKEIMGWLFER